MKEKLIGKYKQSPSEEIQIRFQEIGQGLLPSVDLRVWVVNAPACLDPERPTGHGLHVPVAALPWLIETLKLAQEVIRLSEN